MPETLGGYTMADKRLEKEEEEQAEDATSEVVNDFAYLCYQRSDEINACSGVIFSFYLQRHSLQRPFTHSTNASGFSTEVKIMTRIMVRPIEDEGPR